MIDTPYGDIFLAAEKFLVRIDFSVGSFGTILMMSLKWSVTF